MLLLAIILMSVLASHRKIVSQGEIFGLEIHLGH
jgi:hypothetical protein